MPIEHYRDKIDEVDGKIVELLEKRVDLAKKIGVVKRKQGLPVSDAARENSVLSRVTGMTKLNKGFVRKIFEEIITYCRENE
jgi:chorismate mutase